MDEINQLLNQLLNDINSTMDNMTNSVQTSNTRREFNINALDNADSVNNHNQGIYTHSLQPTGQLSNALIQPLSQSNPSNSNQSVQSLVFIINK